MVAKLSQFFLIASPTVCKLYFKGIYLKFPQVQCSVIGHPGDRTMKYNLTIYLSFPNSVLCKKPHIKMFSGAQHNKPKAGPHFALR